jgi:hypothetical protein
MNTCYRLVQASTGKPTRSFSLKRPVTIGRYNIFCSSSNTTFLFTHLNCFLLKCKLFSDSEKCQIQLKPKHGIQPEHCRLETFNGKVCCTSKRFALCSIIIELNFSRVVWFWNFQVWLVTLPHALTFVYGSEFEGRIELKNNMPFQLGSKATATLYLESVSYAPLSFFSTHDSIPHLFIDWFIHCSHSLCFPPLSILMNPPHTLLWSWNLCCREEQMREDSSLNVSRSISIMRSPSSRPNDPHDSTSFSILWRYVVSLFLILSR